jgi:hypothetical protein
MLVEYLSVPRRKGTRPCTIVRTRTGADLWSCGDDCRWSPSSAAATLILRASRAGAAIADGVAEARTASAGSLVSLCGAAIAAHTVRGATNAAQHVATPRRVATVAVDTASAAASLGVADPPESAAGRHTHAHTRAREHTHQHKLGRRKARGTCHRVRSDRWTALSTCHFPSGQQTAGFFDSCVTTRRRYNCRRGGMASPTPRRGANAVTAPGAAAAVRTACDRALR